MGPTKVSLDFEMKSPETAVLKTELTKDDTQIEGIQENETLERVDGTEELSSATCSTVKDEEKKKSKKFPLKKSPLKSFPVNKSPKKSKLRNKAPPKKSRTRQSPLKRAPLNKSPQKKPVE